MTVSLSFISKSLLTSIEFGLFKTTRARLNSSEITKYALKYTFKTIEINSY